MRTQVEVCVDTYESALNAKEGGAHRLEICGPLSAGGTTPSCGLIKRIKEMGDIDYRIMIRNRPGDFCYSDLDLLSMVDEIIHINTLVLDDVRHFKGYVFGALTTEGAIDRAAFKKIVKAASPNPVIFHRAFDCIPDGSEHLIDHLKLLHEIGCSGILTGGCEASAYKGLEVIKEMVRNAPSMEIIAGSGVRTSNVKELVERTGVVWVHSSCAERVEHHFGTKIDPTMSYHNVVSPSIVKEFVNILSNMS